MDEGEYTRLHGNSTASRVLHNITSRNRSLNRAFRAVSQVTIYTFAFVGLAAMLRNIFNPASDTTTTTEAGFVSCSCGESVAEAISRGCKYDLLASAWLPKQCRDDELSAEFDRSGPGLDGEWTYVSILWFCCNTNAVELGRF